MHPRLSLFLILILPAVSCTVQSQPVKTGAEVLLDKHLHELQGKRIGLVMNPTARVDGTHMLDTLLALDVNVTALFASEHGFRGEVERGERIEDGIDRETGLPVYSLYGRIKKPTPGMLEKVDLLLFDMQDVGGRFYTYNITLGQVIEAAAENGVPVWVLDRPNPAGGDYVAGWVLEEEYRSFVGAYPIPMAHGMTLGELAKMMVGERWIEYEREPELRVIPMEGWDRSMKWPDTGLKWHPPSPNLPSFEHAYLYLGTVLFEGTGLSEGRGTEDPFLAIGSPDTDLPEETIDSLRGEFPGITIQRAAFTPRSIPVKAANPQYEGEECFGVKLSVNDYGALDPVTFGVRLLDVMLRHTGNSETQEFLYLLAGTDSLDTGWEKEIREFKTERKPYLIY